MTEVRIEYLAMYDKYAIYIRGTNSYLDPQGQWQKYVEGAAIEAFTMLDHHVYQALTEAILRDKASRTLEPVKLIEQESLDSEIVHALLGTIRTLACALAAQAGGSGARSPSLYDRPSETAYDRPEPR